MLCKVKSPLMLDLWRLAKPLSDLVNSILELTHNSWRIPELVWRMLACSTGVIFSCFSCEWRQSQSKRGVRLSSLAWKPSLTRKSHLNGSWILAKFFLHIYSPRWSQGQLKHKKERGHYSHLDQTNLVKKGFIALTLRDQRGKSQAGKMAPLIHLLEFVLLYVCLCSAVWSSFRLLSLKSIGIALFFKWLFCHIATTEVINKTGKEIKNELRESLNKLSADKKDRVVMVYFMGYTRKVRLCYFQVNKLTLTLIKMVAVINFAKAGISSRFFVGLDSSSARYSNMRGVEAFLVVSYNFRKYLVS